MGSYVNGLASNCLHLGTKLIISMEAYLLVLAVSTIYEWESEGSGKHIHTQALHV